MINTPPWTGGTDEEYETQYFGFGAQRFKIAVRQMVEQKIQNGVKYMESSIQDSLGLNDTDRKTLTRSCDKLIRLYCERAESSLEVIDEEFERLLKIPQNVLLPEDEVQLNHVSEEEYQNLNDEISNLRKRVHRAALMEAVLTAEEEELSSVEKVCEIATKNMDQLDVFKKKLENPNTVKSVQHEVQFLCSRVPFMQKPNKEDLFED
ncbi:unnamed protein product [Colias eurytheme]|nr:unnamed protein product [Colias eurytheme]